MTSSWLTRVEGEEAGEVVLYALSTCVWCRKTRQLLDSLGIAYSFVYVDLLGQADQEEATRTMQAHNPRRSFPTFVVDGSRVVAGFDEKAIREALGK